MASAAKVSESVRRTPPPGVEPNDTDLAPVPLARRDWTWVNMSTVWMGMVHNVVAYETAAGLMSLGLNAWQAIAATAIVYLCLFLAMWFNAVSGTRYGLPFCVLIRSSLALWVHQRGRTRPLPDQHVVGDQEGPRSDGPPP